MGSEALDLSTATRGGDVGRGGGSFARQGRRADWLNLDTIIYLIAHVCQSVAFVTRCKSTSYPPPPANYVPNYLQLI